MLLLTVIFVAIVSSAFAIPQAQEGQSGSSGEIDCTCKHSSQHNETDDFVCKCPSKDSIDCKCKSMAIFGKPDDHICKCGADNGFDCTCKASGNSTEDYTCKCGGNATAAVFTPGPGNETTTPAGGPSNGTEAPPDLSGNSVTPSESLAVNASNPEVNNGTGNGGEMDCTCKHSGQHNETDNFVCKCPSQDSIDCKCRSMAIFGKPDDHICKCGADNGFDCTCKASGNSTDDYTCKCGGNATASVFTPGPGNVTTTPAGGPSNGTEPPPDLSGNSVTASEGLAVNASNPEVNNATEGDLICICQTSANSSGPYVCTCNHNNTGTAAPNATTPDNGSLEVNKPTPATQGPVAPPGTGNETTGTPQPGGNDTATKTYVMCVKQANKTAQPDADFLTDDTGRSVKVNGQWQSYKCKNGLVEPFRITKTEFEDLTKKCQAIGYDHPQPSDDTHLSSYPFQYDNFITEYYRHRTPFTFNHIPQMPLDRCVDLKRRLLKA